ncbi:Short chain isoprenyl diphosphate synthase [uncultured archaeon]|nr:Short chain isoprenyl diphosphate synthase [uncultured archaeon]
MAKRPSKPAAAKPSKKMPMDIMAYLSAKGNEIGAATIKSIERRPNTLLRKMMLDYPLRGGKHLRSVLCAGSCKAFGGDTRKAMNTLIALELFQHWILIHDDIEDFSEERRGKPALHKIYGVPLANNAGDSLHILMWDALLDNRKVLGEERAFKVLKEFNAMADRCTQGQHVELEWVTFRKWDMSENDYYAMCKGKTCGYTFITPFRLGAIIAGAPESKLEAFTAIGDNIGLAFQIEDDVLNLVGEEGKYGKEIAGDIWEGKRTLMLIHLMRNCTKSEKAKALAIMNKDRDKKTDKEVKYILGLMKKYGSIAYAKEKAIGFARKARRDFDRDYAFLKNSESKRFIEALFDFVINRDL